MKPTNILLLFYTVYYLKSKQIFFRIYYFIRTRWRKIQVFIYPSKLPSLGNNMVMENSIPSIVSYRKNKFIFLNLSHYFDNEINWNFSVYGKLWVYNLTYFEYLNQVNMSGTVGLELINDYIKQGLSIKDGFEPFPISLRGINWIKFLTKHQIQDQTINNSLYAQYFILLDNLEYHILGNHLLENAFSLLFGAYYFQDEKFYAKAKKILTDELEEQILEDGAHFELSPMYHQIMLFRVLDCINLVKNNNWRNQELLELLICKAEIMLGWLNTITYENGDIPLLNDSTNNIAPTTKELNEYASILQVKTKKLDLNDSGYRKIKNEQYEMVIDVGNIGPDYIPGHAHSDTFNFELYIDGKPFIVDTGLSTYETNVRRTLERSTISHNTVEIDGTNQSEVWGGFRVARRAKIIELDESDDCIEATHDGYRRIGALHTRKFIMYNESIMIEDHIKSTSKHECIAYLHFYPGVEPEINGSDIVVNDVLIRTENTEPKIENYFYAQKFNTLTDAKMIALPFTNTLKVSIKL